MIGIVIVSHSAKIAEGVQDLVQQMTQGKVPLAVAGGTDNPENPIGTDAVNIQLAIETVYSDAGVVVIMDLGSALLSAEMAREFFTPEEQAKIRLCSAPLVEGAVAATVEAMGTEDIEQVIAAALGGLTPKQEELQDVSPVVSAVEDDMVLTTAKEIRLTIHNRHGLHARPAAQFVSTAAGFEAEVSLQNATTNKGPVNAKSINRVATLGVRQEHEIVIAAQGPDASQLLAALQALVEANFGEADDEPEPMTPASAKPPTKTGVPAEVGAPTGAPGGEGQIVGLAASPGIAIGPAALYQLAAIEVSARTIDNPEAEWRRLDSAIRTAKREITAVYKQAVGQVGQHEADIFQAHRLFLEDPDMVEPARRRIFEDRLNAEFAWQRTVDEQVDKFRNLDDAYLQARAADVADVGRRVLKLLTGAHQPAIELSQPAILIASDLTPSDTAQLDAEQVLGICTAFGTATSHTAILARALGIPAVVGVGPNLTQIPNEISLALDGQTGEIWLDPDPDKLAELETKRDLWLAAQAQAQKAGRHLAATKDGQRVEVFANVGGVKEAERAVKNGAEGVGLLRTEFLYLERETAPTEDEQYDVYRKIAEVIGRRPIVFRTLDIGGDKPLAYMELEPEANPFLGWRGIRISLAQPEMFKTQIRAILRASPGRQFKIMFPMVSCLDEVQATKNLLAEVQQELRQANISFAEDIEIGVMIEVPAAVINANQLAAEVDFFSIGTNDLSQYTMATDRTNAKVAGLATPFQPAVLRSIQQTIDAAHAAGIWVGLCGEFGGNPLAAPILLGLGLDEFSMSSPAIPTIKQTIGQFTLAEAKEIAKTALKLKTAAEVQAYVEAQLKDIN